MQFKWGNILNEKYTFRSFIFGVHKYTDLSPVEIYYISYPQQSGPPVECVHLLLCHHGVEVTTVGHAKHHTKNR